MAIFPLSTEYTHFLYYVLDIANAHMKLWKHITTNIFLVTMYDNNNI